MDYTISKLNPFGIRIEPIRDTFPIPIQKLDRSKLRQLFYQEHLILLRGFITFDNAPDFAQYCETFGAISIWPFGKVLELIEQDQPEDHIFDHRYVPLHWDGMYRPQVPEMQIFHCVKAPPAGLGGKTTFSNTILTLDHTPTETKNLWRQITGIYQRKMAFYHSKTKSALITKHPFRDFEVIRYNELPNKQDKGFINPPHIEFTGVDNNLLPWVHDSLTTALYHPKNFYAHEWQAGDVLIADNFSLLHGREAFITQSPRHLQRVHVLSDPPLENPGLEFHQE
ncbi:MAG: pyoverdine biosynthesis protein PvcB [Legionella sp. 40-6]|nr:TauD/TfdA family dioxygenase [Legionella sp.]OJY22903.1 MAG: pyoverdine biosynthesis protein PvcB [Legionella sp. 40-6]